MKAFTIMNHCTIFLMLFLTGSSIFSMDVAKILKQKKSPVHSYTIQVTDPSWGFYRLIIHSKHGSYPSLPSNADTIISNYLNAVNNAALYPTKSEAPGDYYDVYGQEAKNIVKKYKKDYPWLAYLNTTFSSIPEPVTSDFSDPVSSSHIHPLVTMPIKEEIQQIISAPILPDVPTCLSETIPQTAPIESHTIVTHSETLKPTALQTSNLNSVPHTIENTPQALSKEIVTNFFNMLKGRSSKEKEASILQMIDKHPLLKRWPVKVFDPKDPCITKEISPDQKDNFSLLHVAASRGYPLLVERLIVDCPDIINMATNNNITPLNSALSQGDSWQIKCLELLLENGANFHQETNTDKSPFLSCIWKGNISGAEILVTQKEAYFTTEGQINLFFGTYNKRINEFRLESWVKEKIENTKNIIINHCLKIGNIQKTGKDSQGNSLYHLDPHSLTQLTQKRKRDPESHPDTVTIAKKQRLNQLSLSPIKQESMSVAHPHSQLLSPTTQAGLLPPTNTLLDVPQKLLPASITDQFFSMLKKCGNYYDKAREQEIINMVKLYPQLMTWPITVVDDKNISQVKVYSTDDNFSFLNCTVHLGLPLLTQYLIEKKPELINMVTEKGTTPLCSVIQRSSPEHIKCLKLLIDNRAQVNQINLQKIHKTALNQALLHGNIQGAQLLLENGAYFTHQNQLKVFMSAFWQKQKHPSLAKSLKENIMQTKQCIINHLVTIKNIAIGQDQKYRFINNRPHETRKIIQYEPYQESI